MRFSLRRGGCFERTIADHLSIVAAALLLGLVFLPRAYGASSGPVASPQSSAAPAFAATPAEIPAISANPAAVEIIPGTGALGRLAGFTPDSGVRIGGFWIGNVDYLATGGVKPTSWSYNSLLVLNLNLDADKLIGVPGGSFDASLLQLNVEPANKRAGNVISYDGLVGATPLDRTQLYELWWCQQLFDDKLTIRVGKTVPTYDFNNVSRPVPVSDQSLAIPAVTSLIFTPIFKNPTMIGASPGYYNSAYGITGNFAPTRHFYLSGAIYDGSGATGAQTGLRDIPVFDGHYFAIAESGYAWLFGDEQLPGKIAVGGWTQTGRLYGPHAEQQGAQGAYAFGSQRIWRKRAGVDNSGVSGYFQLGFNDSRTMLATRYLGLGLTAFDLIHRRPADSFGGGLGWSWLNRRYGFRSNEAILQTYYQMHLISSSFLEPVLSYIPNPGRNPQTQGAVALTAQLVVLF